MPSTLSVDISRSEVHPRLLLFHMDYPQDKCDMLSVIVTSRLDSNVQGRVNACISAYTYALESGTQGMHVTARIDVILYIILRALSTCWFHTT